MGARLVRVKGVEYAIARGVAAGDAAIAFDDLFAAAYHRVVGAVAVVTGDEAHAEDAVQEAFALAHRRWARVGRLDRPDLRVTQVALRIALDGWRRRRRESPLTAGVPAAVSDDIIQRLWGAMEPGFAVAHAAGIGLAA